MKYLLLVSFFFLTQFVFSAPPDLQKYLNLSSDQINKIDKIAQNNEGKRTDLHLKMQIKHLELKQLLLENDINPDAVKTKLDEIAKIETELRFSILLEDIEITKLLNPDQKDKYRVLRAQMKGFNEMPMMFRGPKKIKQ